MRNRRFTFAVASGILGAVVWTLGCEGDSPSRPTPLPSSTPTPTPLSIQSIAPPTGSTVVAVRVTIHGTGFVPGATVTLGMPATDVIVVSNTTITATAPASNTGTVDVVVMNPGGGSARLSGGFEYILEQPYTVTSSTETVVAGGQLSVSWTAPRRGALDWIGFFKVGESNFNYELRWWQYTGDAVSGTLQVTAPNEPGVYEFRYLPRDGYVDTAQSRPITVAPR